MPIFHPDTSRDAQLGAVEDDLIAWFDRPPFAETVLRLRLPRRDPHGGLTLAAEVCDWRRFAGEHQFMGFVGLVPTEYSSGGSTRRAISPRRATPTAWLMPPVPEGPAVTTTTTG